MSGFLTYKAFKEDCPDVCMVLWPVTVSKCFSMKSCDAFLCKNKSSHPHLWRVPNKITTRKNFPIIGSLFEGKYVAKSLAL